MRLLKNPLSCPSTPLRYAQAERGGHPLPVRKRANLLGSAFAFATATRHRRKVTMVFREVHGAVGMLWV
jgi:hypothetical protein